MSPLRWLLDRLMALVRLVRRSPPAVRLRLFLSLFTKYLPRHSNPSSTEAPPAIELNAVEEMDSVAVCLSKLPSSSVGPAILHEDDTSGVANQVRTSVLWHGTQERDRSEGEADERSDYHDPKPHLPAPGMAMYEHNIRPKHLKQLSPLDLPHSISMPSGATEVVEFKTLSFQTTFPHCPPKGYEAVASLGKWRPFTHPLGFLYFYHPDKNIWTSAYMYAQNYYEQVNSCIVQLEDDARGLVTGNSPSSSQDYELVVDVIVPKDGPNGFSWSYYYVDHSTRSIFWLEEGIVKVDVSVGMQGSPSPDHIGHKIEELYWRHIYLFPSAHGSSYPTNVVVWNELLDYLEFQLLDLHVEPNSTCKYSKTELEQMHTSVLRALDRLRDNHQLSSYQLSSLARIQMLMAEQCFRNSYGQPSVWLKSRDSLFAIPPPRWARRLRHFMDFVLLGEPAIILRDFNSILVDDHSDLFVSRADWRDFLDGLSGQWEEFIVVSTVMLAVNLSFLAIPGAIRDTDGTERNHISSLFAYISAVLALGSMSSSLAAHVRYSPARIGSSKIDRALSEDLRGQSSNTLVIIYAIPFALLAWSMITFAVAIAFAPFSPGPIPLPVAVILPLQVLVNVLWRIWVLTWQSTIRQWQSTKHQWKSTKQLWKKCWCCGRRASAGKEVKMEAKKESLPIPGLAVTAV